MVKAIPFMPRRPPKGMIEMRSTSAQIARAAVLGSSGTYFSIADVEPFTLEPGF